MQIVFGVVFFSRLVSWSFMACLGTFHKACIRVLEINILTWLKHLQMHIAWPFNFLSDLTSKKRSYLSKRKLHSLNFVLTAFSPTRNLISTPQKCEKLGEDGLFLPENQFLASHRYCTKHTHILISSNTLRIICCTFAAVLHRVLKCQMIYTEIFVYIIFIEFDWSTGGFKM